MKTIYIKTTETCNLDCDHCFTSGSQGRKVFWNPGWVMSWVKQLDEREPRDVPFHFEFHGGEPFLCKIEDLMRVSYFLRDLKRPVTLGMTSNLVMNLGYNRMHFINECLDSISTSWDSGMRFQNDKQRKLWEYNVKTLSDGKLGYVNTSVNRALIEADIETVFKKAYLNHGVKHVRFERITVSGNALINRDIIPTNQEVDDWLVKVYKLHQEKQWDITVSNFTEMENKLFERRTNVGTYVRNCEQSLYTLNADGSISGCPNDAPELLYGDVSQSLEVLEVSPKRVFQILKEQTLNPSCYECDLFDVCGGGCYKLPWDETGCPTPKNLLKTIQLKG